MQDAWAMGLVEVVRAVRKERAPRRRVERVAGGAAESDALLRHTPRRHHVRNANSRGMWPWQGPK